MSDIGQPGDLGSPGYAFGYRPEPPDTRDLLVTVPQYDLPKKVDWTEQVTGVKDQNNEGVCVGFSVAAIKEFQEWRQEGRKIDLSERWIYEMAKEHDEWPGSCVDVKTKLLSKRGWLSYSEVKSEEWILTLNLQREGLEWQQLEKLHLFHPTSEIELFSFRGKTSIINLTPNHKCVVLNRNTGRKGGPKKINYSLVRADELRSQHCFPKQAPYLECPLEPKYSNEIVELVAWVMTEGYYRKKPHKGNGVCITQSTKKYLYVIERCLRVLKAPYSLSIKNSTDGVLEISRNLALKLRELAPNTVPTLDFLFSLTAEQLSLFIDTCILADGTIKKSPYRKICRVFFQLDPRKIEIFQIACVLNGISTNTYRKDSESKIQIIKLLHSKWFQIRKMQLKKILYRGILWCPQTSNKTFVAKRNGTIFITGNSYDGTSIRGAMKALAQHGICKEKHWPYVAGERGEPDEEAAENAYRYRIEKYRSLTIPKKDIRLIKRGLHETGPVVLAFAVHETWFNVGGDGIIKKPGPKDQILGYHAVPGIAYDEKYFKIKNSWGKSWGADGFGYLAFDYAMDILHSAWAAYDL